MPTAKPKVTGLLGAALLYQGPMRIEGAEQRGGPWVPLACPKCRAEEPMWVRGVESRCIACGTRWVQTRFHHTVSIRRRQHPPRLHPPEEMSA